jgi:hypothetical protein
VRKHGRTDANQQQIIDALRECGCSVFDTSSLGNGFPDLAVARHGVNYLLEVKDGTKSPSRRKLTPDEERFRSNWRGTVFTVESIQDALETLGIVGYRVKASDVGD